MPTITGPFEVTPTLEPTLDDANGVVIGRMRFDKVFTGPLAATSVVHMTSVMTPVEGSAAYVAIEKITGAVAGRSGSLTVVHVVGVEPGEDFMKITIMPNSGTDELAGITGTMTIENVAGQHHYALSYELPSA